MALVPSTPPSLLRRAGAAACLGLLSVVLQAPVSAAPELDALGPRVLAADYLAQNTAGGDSGTVYAKMWVPRSKTGALHLHGGVFAPINASATSATIGARMGANLGDPLLFGLMAEWIYHSKSLLEPVNTGLPGFEPQTVLATVQAHLIPAMAFLEITLTRKLPLVPYVGVAAGYEWLVLNAEDNRTAADSSVTYGNWAWQWYGGVGLKLSDALRVDGEVFYNGGALARDVYDVNGVRRKETVDVEGVGARIGLNIVY